MSPETWRSFRPPKRAPADYDHRDRKLLAQRIGLAGIAGLGGGMIGFLVVRNVLGFGVGFVLGAAASWQFIELVARLAAKFYMPTGSTTPYKRQFSQAKALAIQGKYEAAIAEYERDIAEDPTEAEPYLQIARILRDRLGRHEEAIAWFKRARREARLSEGEDILTAREIVEVLTLRLAEPRRALPELARLLDTYPTAPAAQWARREMAEIRATSFSAES